MLNTREKLIELLETVVSPKELLCDGEVLVSTAKVADHLIANGVTVQEWIPVTERLPEMYKNVLTIRTDGKIRFDAIGSLGVWYEEVWHTGTPVTHWMPLPEPPKGE